ncbi:hypothetical protein GGR63_000122 [Xanthomonas sp. 3272]|uniref:hypothetical protein n=1 Tax=Xanthomonas arboricola TaxID=56448 RepID=UPI00142FC1EF|nr:hypothetical protein [Xanthomonas arboricola]NJC00235.1 hypothetical protein [Xanthomonas arboricola]
MAENLNEFFSASLAAGAILTGFCGTFLSFRIQREASYYRQPAVDFRTGKGRDVFIGLSHFTSSFLLLAVATLLAIVFGFALPLLALYGLNVSRQAVVIGILNSLLFVCAYFVCEMVHYGILNRRLLHDRAEWGRSKGLVAATCLISGVLSFCVGRYL